MYKLKVAGLFAQFHESFLYLGATSGNFSISKKVSPGPTKTSESLLSIFIKNVNQRLFTMRRQLMSDLEQAQNAKTFYPTGACAQK